MGDNMDFAKLYQLLTLKLIKETHSFKSEYGLVQTFTIVFKAYQYYQTTINALLQDSYIVSEICENNLYKKVFYITELGQNFLNTNLTNDYYDQIKHNISNNLILDILKPK